MLNKTYLNDYFRSHDCCGRVFWAMQTGGTMYIKLTRVSDLTIDLINDLGHIYNKTIVIVG